MTSTPPRRPSLAATLGMALLFAGAGPAVGGAVFIPLAFLMEAPAAADATLHLGWIVTLIGHALALIPAYVVGFGPAIGTGIAFALWNALAPAQAPRALFAAAIGGALTYGQFVWPAQISAPIARSISLTLSAWGGSWFDDVFTGEFDMSLQRALVASGAVAGFVCALAANLLGLTPARPVAEGSLQ